ncbi:MAG: dihydrolipoyl dehydrogenase [Thermoanaerobaculia bacterium]
MSERREVRIPDLGGADGVTVIEVLVSAGDRVEAEAGLVTLESDKASMDVPTPVAGTVVEIRMAAGDAVAEGDLVAVLEVGASGATSHGEAEEAEEAEETEEETAGPHRTGPEEGRSSDDEEEPAVTRRGGGGRDEKASRRQWDVVVLGAGPGGYTAAFRAADLGLRVALVERHSALGGVCLNVGCIPSKALLHAARVLDEAAGFAEHGIRFGEPQIDIEKLGAWKESVVRRLTGGLAKMAEQRGVEIVRGDARFVSDRALDVEDEGGTTRLDFRNAIVAAGSRVVRISGVPWDDERVLDSTAALELRDVPESLLIVGGGIIGLEMATVYAALGSRVTVVELLEGLLPGCDRDLVRPLAERLTGRLGVSTHVSTKLVSVEPRAEGLEASLEGEGAPQTQLFDRILVAVGRRPNGDRIGAEAAGLSVDERGFLGVDRQQRTNVPHILAIGDITGGPMLAHRASHQGKVAAEVCAGEPASFDARVIPSVAYTDPEVAWVGLTETAAQRDGTPYRKAVFPWAASGRSLGMGRSEGSTKLLFDPETDRILGGGIVGPNAGDLISEVALAIEMDCEAGDLALTVHPHPTLSETVAFAAEVYAGTVTDLYQPTSRKSRDAGGREDG